MHGIGVCCRLCNGGSYKLVHVSSQFVAKGSLSKHASSRFVALALSLDKQAPDVVKVLDGQGKHSVV